MQIRPQFIAEQHSVFNTLHIPSPGFA